MRCWLRTSSILALAASSSPPARRPAEPTAEVVAAARAAVPSDPDDAVWKDVPFHLASLILQDMVEPRLLAPSTRELRVRAITDGARLALRLEWKDSGKDDLPGAARFSDACAVQFPAKAAADVPAPQMGEKGRPVEITFWRAAWQAVVDGRGDTIKDLYPGAAVDHYPSRPPPSRRVLRPSARWKRGIRRRGRWGTAWPVPASGPWRAWSRKAGTLSAAPLGDANGRGHRLLMDGPSSSPAPFRTASPRETVQIAFAVWEGSHEEAGARKMRTGWIPIVVETKR